MAIAVRNSSNNSAATGTAMSVAAPTGTTTGDIVVVIAHGNNNTTIVDNNGTTPFTADIASYSPNTTSGETIRIFSRRILAGDPSTYNFTLGTTGRWALVAIAFSGPDATTIYDVAPSTTNAANRDDATLNTINAPTITTLVNNAIHVLCGFSDDGVGGAMTGPVGYTGRGSPVNEPMIALTKTITPAGATGAQTVTATTSSPMIGISFSMYNTPAAGAAFKAKMLTLLGIG